MQALLTAAWPEQMEQHPRTCIRLQLGQEGMLANGAVSDRHEAAVQQLVPSRLPHLLHVSKQGAAARRHC